MNTARYSPHAKAFGWGIAEYVAYPACMLVATPLFLAALGAEGYGLLLLASSVTSLAGASGLGMGAATIRFVAHARGAGDAAEAAAVVRHTLALSLLGGVLVAAAACAAAPWLAGAWFGAMGPARAVAGVIALGAVLLLLQQLDGIFVSAIKGYERFDVAVKLEVVTRVASVAAMLAGAWVWQSVLAAMAASLVAAAGSLAVKAAFASRIAGSPVFVPAWSRATAARLFAFGGWNWLSGLAAWAFLHLDRLVIGSVLGAAALAQYGICAQLAAQVHMIPAAGLGFLFPFASRRLAADPAAQMRRGTAIAILVSLVTASLVAAPLALFGDEILRLWVGAEVAAQAGWLLFWMTLVYWVAALGTTPHYLLLGRGDARFVSVTLVGAGITGAAFALVLIPVIGVLGGVLGRAMHLPFIVASYWRLYQRRAAHA